MIPKIIHYCWFGRNPKGKLAEKCLKSWKKYCKDYKIIEWNEDNFDISTCPLYVRQAYKMQKWAFVTDYVRLKVVYENGGIYLDTDVQIIKKLDSLLVYDAYFGFDLDEYINTGLGFGAKKGAPILKDIMRQYEDIPFVRDDGTQDSMSCPVRNTEVFLKYGLCQNGEQQSLIDGTIILPKDYLNPLDYWSGELKKTRNTLSIHWYSASWFSKKEKEEHEARLKQISKRKKSERIDSFIHLPNRIMKKILGEKKYRSIKTILKKY